MKDGIYPPITTPFENDQPVLDLLAKNIRRWNETGLAGYVVLGSNGEAAYLTRDEKIRVLETAQVHRAADKLLVAGTGSDSIKETIAFTNRAATIGAEVALVLPPSFFKSAMTDEVLETYFRTVADNTEIPLLIYNVPKFTGVEISPAVVERLAEHPNIIGLKHSSTDLARLSEYIAAVPAEFRVFAGSASVLFPALAMGAAGGILALANLAPQECTMLFEQYRAGKLEAARELQLRLLPVNQAVTARFGVPGLKAAMDLCGWYGGAPRRPLLPMTEKKSSELRKVLGKAGLLKK